MTTVLGTPVLDFRPDTEADPQYGVEFERASIVNPMGKSLYRNMLKAEVSGRITYEFDWVTQTIAEREAVLSWLYNDAIGRKGKFWFVAPTSDLTIPEGFVWGSVGLFEWRFFDTGVFEAWEAGSHRRFFHMYWHGLGGPFETGGVGSGSLYVEMLSCVQEPGGWCDALFGVAEGAGGVNAQSIVQQHYSPVWSRMYLMRLASDDIRISHLGPPGLCTFKTKFIEVPHAEYP